MGLELKRHSPHSAADDGIVKDRQGKPAQFKQAYRPDGTEHGADRAVLRKTGCAHRAAASKKIYRKEA